MPTPSPFGSVQEPIECEVAATVRIRSRVGRLVVQGCHRRDSAFLPELGGIFVLAAVSVGTEEVPFPVDQELRALTALEGQIEVLPEALL